MCIRDSSSVMDEAFDSNNSTTDEPNFSGIMTIKVYGGEVLRLPFPITSNVQILKKLLHSGVINQDTDEASADELVSSLSQLHLSDGGDEENLIDGNTATRYIPATITLPNSTDLNPLLYLSLIHI